LNDRKTEQHFNFSASRLSGFWLVALFNATTLPLFSHAGDSASLSTTEL
jgi:hypothetical protein